MQYTDTGIMVEEGIFVSSIEPGSAAAADDSVTVGDRLLNVSLVFFSHLITSSATHQCVDAVAWVAGRASGLQKTEWLGAGLVICLEQGVQICISR